MYKKIIPWYKYAGTVALSGGSRTISRAARHRSSADPHSKLQNDYVCVLGTTKTSKLLRLCRGSSSTKTTLWLHITV